MTSVEFRGAFGRAKTEAVRNKASIKVFILDNGMLYVVKRESLGIDQKIEFASRVCHYIHLTQESAV